jgi:hypothetical protein
MGSMGSGLPTVLDQTTTKTMREYLLSKIFVSRSNMKIADAAAVAAVRQQPR